MGATEKRHGLISLGILVISITCAWPAPFPSQPYAPASRPFPHGIRPSRPRAVGVARRNGRRVDGGCGGTGYHAGAAIQIPGIRAGGLGLSDRAAAAWAWIGNRSAIARALGAALGGVGPLTSRGRAVAFIGRSDRRVDGKAPGLQVRSEKTRCQPRTEWCAGPCRTRFATGSPTRQPMMSIGRRARAHASGSVRNGPSFAIKDSPSCSSLLRFC